jgi:hypothetical protein
VNFLMEELRKLAWSLVCTGLALEAGKIPLSFAFQL